MEDVFEELESQELLFDRGWLRANRRSWQEKGQPLEQEEQAPGAHSAISLARAGLPPGGSGRMAARA